MSYAPLSPILSDGREGKKKSKQTKNKLPPFEHESAKKRGQEEFSSDKHSNQQLDLSGSFETVYQGTGVEFIAGRRIV